MFCKVVRFLQRAADAVYIVSKTAIILSLGVMVVLVFLQVFFRYVLRDSLIWAIELSTLLMVWIVFMGCSIAYRDNEVIAVSILTDRLKGRVKVVSMLLVDIIMLGFLLFTIRLNSAILPLVRMTPMPVLQISSYWKHVSLTVSFSIMCGYCILHMIETLMESRNSSQEVLDT